MEKIEQETWRETGISFVTSVTRLMERLLDYRWRTHTHAHIFRRMLVMINCVQGIEKVMSFARPVFRDCMRGDETENKKMGCTVNLLVRFGGGANDDYRTEGDG